MVVVILPLVLVPCRVFVVVAIGVDAAVVFVAAATAVVVLLLLLLLSSVL